ncbi:SDR family NAD(P)-dependent oxidoreductase [Archangium violaceum]|uniref:SDR family NAD(P)-dependent oxidoreductase n=1 Tax=Archangium violaceum TaxID=83451 RepID=UPI001950B7A4|nr:SDR family NAD(P)-dependent oxidoreductase [Archangium violaceum]QRN95332.1 SDR family NAD(P)-dependent oxidoreductase [Archangium violaceum]
MAGRNKKEASRLSLGALTAAGVGAVMGLRALLREKVSFEGRTVLLTGGSRGLGLVLARQFLKEGARVILSAREEVELTRARDELEKDGAGEVLAIPCDVSDRVQVEAMVAQVHERFGAVDVLVNNAGTIQVGPLESMTEEDFDEAMDVHFWAPLYTTLAVLPEMKRRGWGRIVNISSIGGKVSIPHLLPYSASKFALVGLSDGLRAELAQDGILVTTVCPGLMRTGSPPNAFFKGNHEAEYAWFVLGDSLPGMSMNAERAARKIVEACRRGDAEALIGMPAKVAALARTLAPGLTAAFLAHVNRMMPQDSSTDRHRGRDSETPLTRSWVTQLTRRAAQKNNEELLH